MTTGRIDRRSFLTASAAAASAAALPAPARGQPLDIPADAPITIEEFPSGFVMRKGPETVRVRLCADDIVHVVAGPANSKGASPQTPWLVSQDIMRGAEFSRTAEKAMLRTSKLSVEVDLKKGLLRFLAIDHFAFEDVLSEGQSERFLHLDAWKHAPQFPSQSSDHRFA